MPEESSNAWAARRQIELAVARLESLSTLPCVGAELFSRLIDPQFSPLYLVEIVESDPVLAAGILRLVGREARHLSEQRFSLRRVLDKLAPHVVRDAVLSVKVDEALEPEAAKDEYAPQSRKGLILHCLAVACCSAAIYKILSPDDKSRLPYMAGLLHDIGKFALQEALPKSFSRIVEEARAEQSGACAIEVKHLGADHAILGKRLAQKWRFPEQITLAVWLHHSDTATISRTMPEARLAQVVQLADLVARQSGIGRSGSYDVPGPVDEAARSLGVSYEQVAQIARDLPAEVEGRAGILGLDMPDATATFCSRVQAAAAKWGREQAELSLANIRLQTTANHLDFLTEFVLGIAPNASAIDVAEDFAKRWQKFYQTGSVCLYLSPSRGSGSLEAVVVEALAQSKTLVLDAPPEMPAVPVHIADRFAILNAQDNVDWLLEQLDTAFDLDRTKLVPLLSAGKAVGAMAFELNYPGDAQLFEEKFRTSASTAGSVLHLARVRERQQDLAERFAAVISKSGPAPAAEMKAEGFDVSSESLLDVLAEMAAGAAHELNNPLSVISGRAQLLAEAESDQEKKKILKQIHDNASEASAIIESLMSFAEPPRPKRAATDVRQLLEEAIQLTSRKTNVEHINAQITVDPDADEVFVDSAQIVSAVANIVANSVESYSGELGPVKITAEAEAKHGMVELKIADLGCGMEPEVVRKAAQPFFSAKPAGRRRGMGLAYAARFIQLNKGSVTIESKPAGGTTVTVRLPRK